MPEQPLSKLKGDDREWAIESAAKTLKDFARIRRDKPMLKAARAYLKQEIADSKKGMTIQLYGTVARPDTKGCDGLNQLRDTCGTGSYQLAELGQKTALYSLE